VIAEPTERRSSKRFTVEADRADIVVEFGGEDHRAVMSDMSATGFGLLLLKGSHVASGDHVQLNDPDTDTTFDLEVVHVRPEDGFQYVGLRRMSDKTLLSIPLFRFAGKTYELKMPADLCRRRAWLQRFGDHDDGVSAGGEHRRQTDAKFCARAVNHRRQT